MEYIKHKTNITLYNSYFDLNDNLTPKSILNIFQDIASVHAEDIGVGYKTMLDENLYWVLSRVKFDILKMPKPNQTVVAETWPHEKGRIDFDRDFLITTTEGEILIKGTSKWCVIDTTTRSLQRTDNINYIGVCSPDKNYQDRFGKIILPEMDTTTQFDHKVMFADLDHNQHMNNTNYATLVSNAISNKNISHFEINFVNECKLDDVITIQSISEDGEYIIGTVLDKTAFVAYTK